MTTRNVEFKGPPDILVLSVTFKMSSIFKSEIYTKRFCEMIKKSLRYYIPFQTVHTVYKVTHK